MSEFDKGGAGCAQWYRDAIIYQTHVRAFADSDDDGIGDFQGLIGKLDYLQDLGVTAIWLLPFYPSPLRDDGYDIANYVDVNAAYGTLADFEQFLAEAHRRNLRVITELVLNHTSDQHLWFQQARRAAAGSALRDFYVWSDDPQKYADARIIFQDFEPSNWTWDPVAGAYFWHRFFYHQPDLNFENPEVHRATLAALDFWLSRGVDGLRLDAVPYLYEREGTNCENLPETHAYLKKLRKHVDERFADRMLLAEANQWPEDAIAYFGDGDECHMAFHFPLMPRLFMALRMEDRFPIADILEQTPAIPEACQWAVFLRNHDELTLEMVTDEDRDYMYRFYAQDPQMRLNLGIRRRLAPLLENHRGKIELMNGLLFSLPGAPVIYYGDEIGMGDNIYLGDRNGVRTPMQWNAERNAGFSRANPQRLYMPLIIDPEYHYQAVNVESQQNNPHSLLWWMKRLIALRKRHPALGHGKLEFIPADNSKVLAFVRRTDEECILVVANLSRLPQHAELDLSAFQGRVPTELLGQTPFTAIGERPYSFTFGSYAFYWLGLEASAAERPVPTVERKLPSIEVPGPWDEVFRGPARQALHQLLPQYLQRCRWFPGRGRQIETATMIDAVPLSPHEAAPYLTLVLVKYSAGDAETYLLPLAFVAGDAADQVAQATPRAVLARLVDRASREASGDTSGILYDPFGQQPFTSLLVEAIAQGQRLRGTSGDLATVRFPAFDQLLATSESAGDFVVTDAAQTGIPAASSTQRLLKLFRRLEPGVNPELEVGRALAERTKFRNAPELAGAIEYRRGPHEAYTLAVLEGLPSHQGNVWDYTLESLGRFYEQALTRPISEYDGGLAAVPILDLVPQEIPAPARELLGSYVEIARLAGQRTAELHDALVSIPDDPAFAPEPITALYQRSLYQSLRSQALQALALLRRRVSVLPESLRDAARELLGLEQELLRRARRIAETRISALRSRGHGDLHLAKLLFTGKDLIFVDFEGGGNRPLTDRRRKRTPLRDVAEMVFSFHYASLAALGHERIRPEDAAALQPWMSFWRAWVSATFLKAYFDNLHSSLLPKSRQELQTLLEYYLLKRGASNLHFDLLHDPLRAEVPVLCLLQILEAGSP